MPTPMGAHGAMPRPFRVKTRQGKTRWRVTLTMADGRRAWKQASTFAGAQRAGRDLWEQRELDLDPSRQTVEGFLRSWIRSLDEGRRVRPRTLDHYSMIVEQHIIPALGAVKLSALSARRVQAWLDADPASPMTVKHHRDVLRAALNVAVRQRLLAWNPATAVELPRMKATTGDPLTVDEARALLEATREDRLHALWRLAIVTGLRQGELLGLTWEDVDLGAQRAVLHAGQEGATGATAVRTERRSNPEPSSEALRFPATGGSITVNHQLQRLDGKWVRTTTKAARRLERVSIDAETAAVLAEHRIRMAAERKPGDEWFGMVFLTSTGKPIHQAEALKLFHTACDRAGIRRRRFHDLRGTSLTLMREAGVAEDTRMARAGHSTADMARHYAKASTEQDRAAVELLARKLG